MTTEHTPTTQDVRDCYVIVAPATIGSDTVAEFDRWLAEHDRETRAEALEEAAASFEGPDRFLRDTDVRRRLRDMVGKVRA